METTLAVLNDLERSGVVEKYAIGGAFALLFYSEPSLTYDVDVFVFLPRQKDSLLISLDPLYRSLESMGHVADKEHVMIAGVPVQFIPAHNALTEDAVRDANECDYRGTPVRVFKLEYLLAVMLDTNRAKDKARILQLLDEATFDNALLRNILKKHGLEKKWEALLETHR